MKRGLTFLPAVGPKEYDADGFYDACTELSDSAGELGSLSGNAA
ncbi:hypothetical protein [Streptomyces sp. NPDC048644]